MGGRQEKVGMEPKTFATRAEAIRFFTVDKTGDDAKGFVDGAIEDGRIIILEPRR